MEKIKCITFDKEAQNNLPQSVKDKMKANQEGAKNRNPLICTNCKTENIFNRKPYNPVSKEIAGYCKKCGHVVWH